MQLTSHFTFLTRDITPTHAMFNTTGNLMIRYGHYKELGLYKPGHYKKSGLYKPITKKLV